MVFAPLTRSLLFFRLDAVAKVVLGNVARLVLKLHLSHDDSLHGEIVDLLAGLIRARGEGTWELDVEDDVERVREVALP